MIIRLKGIIRRFAKFGIVGVVCTLLQIAILHLLSPFMPEVLASAIGFLISAQVNFLLSYFFTWNDSRRKKGLQFFMTWLRFNGVVLVGAAVNTAAFALIHLVVINAVAVILATAISTSCTYLLFHNYVLTPERERTTDEARHRSVPPRLERGQELAHRGE